MSHWAKYQSISHLLGLIGLVVYQYVLSKQYWIEMCHQASLVPFPESTVWGPTARNSLDKFLLYEECLECEITANFVVAITD